jgi:hypothetical protein
MVIQGNHSFWKRRGARIRYFCNLLAFARILEAFGTQKIHDVILEYETGVTRSYLWVRAKDPQEKWAISTLSTM